MSKITNTILALTLTISFVGSAQSQLLISNRADATGLPQISVHDPATGELQRVLVGGNPETNGGLFLPSAMTIVEDELFVATQVDSILRYDLESGDFLGAFAEGIKLPEAGPFDPTLPSGLYYDDEKGELLVSTLGNFTSPYILRYSVETGELLATEGEGTAGSGRSSIAEGPDGNLYVSSFANGPFFLGDVLTLDSETLEPTVFASNPQLGLAGASGFVFHEGSEEGTYDMDVIGLFSNSVVRFDVATTDDGLTVTGGNVLISEGLDFPSAILPLGDGTMLVTSLGNDREDQGELRPGSIGRYDVATGEFIETYLGPGDPNALAQPNALILLPSAVGDCNGDGVVDAADLECVCAGGELDATLEVLGLLKGDFDQDGEVGFTDFLTLSDGFNEEGGYLQGDMNCSGVVDFEDFLAFSANFGQMTSVAAQVPEPHATALGLLGCLAALAIRRRR